MTDYTQSTNFATKDALTSGNPLKIVKGTEINTEFANISVAIATKANLISPTFTGAPILPLDTVGYTQSTDNNSTALATTAFVKAVMQILYPIGSVYTNASVSTNPGTLFGFGTWVAFAAGRVMIGAGSGYSIGTTGGSADAINVSHTHSATSTDSGHSHYELHSGGIPGTGNGISSANNTGTFTTSVVPTGPGNASITTTISSAGSDGTNANLQPYIVVQIWMRTA